MPQVCFYFHLHQPYRLRNFNVFDLAQGEDYFIDPKDDLNQLVFQKVAQKSYLPMLLLLLKLLKKYPNFKLSLSITGVFLEQAQAYEPKVLALLQGLVKTKKVELLAETYYHSLAFLYSPAEFRRQVRKHQRVLKKIFNYRPTVFRNTELIYNNEIAQQVAEMGFEGVLTEAVDRYLQGRSRTQVFLSKTRSPLPLLLKHARLSDDIAFRFSDKNWSWYPLSVTQYLEWIEVYPADSIVNLFMDFETFGEHQWADTGVFKFFEQLVKKIVENSQHKFVQPGQIFKKFRKKQQKLFNKSTRAKKSKQSSEIETELLRYQLTYDVPDLISWADVDRSITAWRDNDLQDDVLRVLYELEKPVLASKNRKLIEDWRRLQISDHFYYMCTKWAADGDVHAYFSPYQTPFEAYRRYSIVLADLKGRLHWFNTQSK